MTVDQRTPKHARVVCVVIGLALLATLIPSSRPPAALAQAIPPLQGVVAEFRPPRLLSGTGDGADVTTGDLDGDGDLDIALGIFDGTAQILLNDGRAGFGPPLTLPGPRRGTTAIAAGDLDGDGDLDLALASDGQPSRVYRNDGTGQFGDPVDLPAAASTRDLAIGDVTGDGAYDLVLANRGAASQVYRNDGAGGFTLHAELAGGVAEVEAVALGDLDGDVALDVALGVRGARESQIFLNDGAGDFDAATPLPGSAYVYDLAAGDLDFDGVLEIVVGRSGPVLGADQPDLVFARAGDAYTIVATLTDTSFTHGVALGDMNGDMGLDVVTANLDAPGTLATNGLNGALSLTDALFPFATRLPGLGEGGSGVALADFDGDGALDIVQSVRIAGSRLYLSQGAVGFRFKGAFSTDSGDTTQDVAVDDLNGDGLPDLVLANSDLVSQVYLADGTGGFGPPIVLPSVGTGAAGAATGDFDGDGGRDIVLATGSGRGAVYLRQPDGRYAVPAPLSSTPLDLLVFGVLAGDVTGDGADDVIILRTSLPGQLIPSLLFVNRGDGSGTFLPEIPIDGSEAFGPRGALGDLDGDGDLDLLIGNGNAARLAVPARVFRNDGAGGFGDPLALAGSGDLTNDVALGDLNGDGALDVVLGNFGIASQVYLSLGQGAALAFAPPAEVPAAQTTTIALADFDGDADLDLLQGNEQQTNLVYRNDGAGTLGDPTTIPLSDNDKVRRVAAGDFDGDGDQDFVQGNQLNASRVYVNDGAGAFTQLEPLSYLGSFTTDLALGDFDGNGTLNWARSHIFGPSAVVNVGQTPPVVPLPGDDRFAEGIATGDLNGDGALDLVLAKDCETLYGAQSGICAPRPSLVHLNDGAGGFGAGQPLPGSEGGGTIKAVVGDLDGDGPLDVVLARIDGPSVVFRNGGAASFGAPEPIAGSGGPVADAALGDVNGDGALDLVLARTTQPSLLFLNDGLGGFGPPVALQPEARNTVAVALGDVGGDGALDIVLGNSCVLVLTTATCEALPFPSQLLVNDGAGGFGTPGELPATGNGARDVALADMDGDRDLDLVVASVTGEGQNDPVSRVLVNDGAGGFDRAMLIPFSDTSSLSTLAVGDIDSDGAPDIVSGSNGGPTASYRSGRLFTPGLPNMPPTAFLLPAGLRPGAPGYTTPVRVADRVVSLFYFLFDREGDPVRAVRGLYSLDGGGTWRVATPTDTTVTTDLTTRDGAGNVPLQRFDWDIFASGVFGQSDNVLFRIEALQGTRPAPNGVPGPYQRPYATALTTPFRIQGTGIEVVTQAGAPVAGAEVYRVPAGGQQTAPFPDPTRPPRLTTARGVVPGSGALAIGDRLLAIAPITATATYTVYATSGVVTPDGLELHAVETPGLQRLTIDPQSTLVRFNLDVSLEWDARNDPAFLSQLRRDLSRAAEVLYDWTDGQATLGQITVYHARERWDDAHIRIYASNRLRPNAAKGGIVAPGEDRPDPADPADPELAYVAGQVRMGPTWTRYGDSGQALADDWPRALAHELGHFLLYLDDNYIGLDAAGRLITVNTCPGAMSDPYFDDSELVPAPSWLPGCADTLSERLVERSDWESITTFYPWLRAPATYGANAGPTSLPLQPAIRFAEPPTPTTTLRAPRFALIEGAGTRYVPGRGARAYLFQGERLVALGSPVNEEVEARGARPGDRLCVFDPERQHSGCRALGAAVAPLAMASQPGWAPAIQVTPVSSTTLRVDLAAQGLAGQPATVTATLYPANEAPPVTAQLAPAPGGGWRGALATSAEAPVFEGHLHIVAVDAAGIRREAVADFLIGGNPGRKFARNAPRGNPGRKFARNAPVVSADGQAILFGRNLDLSEGQFFALQSVEALPPPPAWVTPVGPGYSLTTTPGASLEGASILIGYLGGDVRSVTGGGEERLKVFFRGVGEERWEALPTQLDSARNEASALARGPGLYALMIDSPFLAGTGWQLFTYTGPELAPAAALNAPPDSFSVLALRDTADQADPWKIFAPGAPDWVNDLRALKPSRQYYIHLLGAGDEAAAALATAPSLSPPAVFYGQVISGGELTAAPGQEVLALIEGTVCGRARTRLVSGQVVYSVDVSAVGPGALASCGLPGKVVSFRVGGVPIAGSAPWDDARVNRADLSALPNMPIYLPMIGR